MHSSPRPSRTLRRRRSLGLEPLEPRLLLDATPLAYPLDWAEPNDSFFSPADLGLLEGGNIGTELNIDDASDEDWFAFETSEAGLASHYVAIEFDHALGDLDLALYDDGGSLIDASTSANDVEEISFAGLPADTYYVFVYGYGGATNPDYTLTLELPGGLAADSAEPNDTIGAAADLGAVTGENTWVDLSIHESGNDDWFVFDTSDTSGAGHFVGIDFDNALGDLDLALYDDTGTLVDYSATSQDSETVPLAGLPGATYYVLVYGYDGATNPDYELTISAPAGITPDGAEPNDTSVDPYDLGQVTSPTTWSSLNVHESGNDDWFVFQTLDDASAGHYVAIDFDHSLGDLDLALYDQGGTLAGYSNTAYDHEEVPLTGLAAGTYYILVYGYNGATSPDYTITIDAPGAPAADNAEPNDTIGQAYDLREVSGLVTWDGPNIHEPGNDDWFAFQTLDTGRSGHYAAIDFQHSLGDLDLALYDDGGTLITSSTHVTDHEEVSLAGLPAGNYYLLVYGYAGAVSPGYTISINAPGAPSGDWAEPNNAIGDAHDLRTVTSETTWTDLNVHQSGDDDWFRFELGGDAGSGHYAGIDFTHSLGDLDLALYDDGGTLITSSTSVRDYEEVSLAGLSAGTYYLLVYGYSGATSPDYSLTICPPGTPSGDAAEPNDSIGQAYDLREATGQTTWSGLNVHEAGNDDWFRFETVETAVAGHSVAIDFQHALGDLDMALYNSGGTLLASSTSARDYEEVSLDGLPAATYYLLVYGYNGATNPGYTITIDAPAEPTGIPQDRFEQNDTIGEAHDLRTLDAHGNIFADLTMDDSASETTKEDWFRFQTTAPGATGDAVGIEFLHAQGDLDLFLYDASSNALGSSRGTGNSETVSLDGLPGGTYYIRVLGYNGASNPDYTLTIDAPSPASGIPEDRFEQNDDSASAHDLRTLAGHGHTFADLTMDDSANEAVKEDWFTFETTATGVAGDAVAIDFLHAQGDLDLALYDGGGSRVGLSNTTGDRETISFDGLAAGTYSLVVYGYNGATNPGYTLTIDAPSAATGIAEDRFEQNDDLDHAHDFRRLTGTQTYTGLTMDDSANEAAKEDWFVFETAAAGTGANFVRISFAHAQGDLDLGLYDDGGSLIESSTSTTDGESVSLSGLAAGTYYVLVLGASGAVNPSYSLTINAPSPQSGEDQAEWTVLAYLNGDDISGGGSWSCETHSFDKINLMESVGLPSDVQVGVLFDRISGFQTTSPDWTDTRVGVVGSDGNLNVLSTQFPSWGGERNLGLAGTLSDFITWGVTNLPAQHYAVFIFGHGGAFTGIAADYTSGGDDLDPAEIRQAIDQSGQHIDIFGCDSCLMGSVEVAYELRNVVDVYIGSEEVEHVPGMDWDGIIEQFANHPDETADQLASRIVQRVGQPWYMHSVSATDTEELDTLAGRLSDFVDSLGSATAADWTAIDRARANAPNVYLETLHDLGKFLQGVADNAPTTAVANAAQAALDAYNDAIIQNYSDSGVNGTGLTIYVPGGDEGYWNGYTTAARFATDARWHTFIQTYQGALVAFSSEGPDWAESNDVMARAYSLGSLAAHDLQYQELSVHNGTDADWFRFTTSNTGGAEDQVLIAFDNALGNLDIALYDASGVLLDAATGSGNVEAVSLSGRAAGTYYVKVHPHDSDSNPNYTLEVDAPTGAADDWSEPYDTFDKAYSLGDPASHPYVGLWLTPGDADWFSFRTSLAVGTDLTVGTTWDAGDGDLDLYVYDQGGQLLGSATTGSGTASVGLDDTEGATYFVRIDGTPAGAQLPYTLAITENLAQPVDQDFITTLDPGESFTFPDADGDTVTVRFGGSAGTVDLTRDVADDLPGDLITLEANGTDGSSTITIKTTRGTETTVQDVLVHGSLKSFMAKTTDLLGDLAVDDALGKLWLDDVAAEHTITIGDPADGLATVSLTFDQVADVTLDSAMPIKLLKATEWLDTEGVADTILAPWIAKLQIKGRSRDALAGHFQASLDLDGTGDPARTLGSAKIAGTLSDCTWDITGDVGTIAAAEAANWDLVVNSDLRSLKLGPATNTTVDVDGAIRSASIADWDGGSLDADSLAKLKIPGSRSLGLDGDLNIDVTLDGLDVPEGRKTLGSATVAGSVTLGNWDIAGLLGKLVVKGDFTAVLNAVTVGTMLVSGDVDGAQIDITEAPDDGVLALKKLTVKGWIVSSFFTVAGHVGAFTAGGMDGSDFFAGVAGAVLPEDAFDFNDECVLRKFTVKGIKAGRAYIDSFINSNIAAWNIVKGSLREVQTDNAAAGHLPFGIAAVDIGSLTWRDGADRFRWPERTPDDWPDDTEDFVLRDFV